MLGILLLLWLSGIPCRFRLHIHSLLLRSLAVYWRTTIRDRFRRRRSTLRLLQLLGVSCQTGLLLCLAVGIGLVCDCVRRGRM